MPDACLVLKGDAPVTIEPKAFAVLQLLAERAPHVLDKAEIFAVVWKDTAVTDNALTRIVAQLRKALDDDAKAPRYIATVSARGYRLLPPVRTIESDAPPARSRRLRSRRLRSARPRRRPLPRRRWPLVVATVAIATVAVLGSWLVFGKRLAVRGFPFGAPLPAITLVRSVGDLRSGDRGRTVAGADDRRPPGTTATWRSRPTRRRSPTAPTDRARSRSTSRGSPKGSSPTSLTRGAGQCIQPAWSPDGRFIAYAELAGDGIWIVPSRGGAARKVAEFGAHPSWSPDGRRIAFQSRPPADLNPGGSFGADSTILDRRRRWPHAAEAADDAGPAARVARHAAVVAGQRARASSPWRRRPACSWARRCGRSTPGGGEPRPLSADPPPVV